jgi:hypothetical protein
MTTAPIVRMRRCLRMRAIGNPPMLLLERGHPEDTLRCAALHSNITRPTGCPKGLGNGSKHATYGVCIEYGKGIDAPIHAAYVEVKRGLSCMADATRNFPSPVLNEGHLKGRLIAFSERDWFDLNLQAAIEGRPGRGDIVRKAVRLYLDGTKDQRKGLPSAAGSPKQPTVSEP